MYVPRGADVACGADAERITASRTLRDAAWRSAAERRRHRDATLLSLSVIVYNVREITGDWCRIMPLRVHSIPARLARVYLIEGDRGLHLVDTGAPGSGEAVLRLMKRIGRADLRLIYITHAHLDHYGSAAALRRITGAPIAIHRADADAMERGETRLGEIHGWGWVMGIVKRWLETFMKPEGTRADIIVEDGDRLDEWGLDAEVVHIPGHTRGSSCLLVEGRLAFVGDLLSTRGGAHAQRFFAEDWSRVTESLDRLKALSVEWVYAGHGRRHLQGKEL